MVSVGDIIKGVVETVTDYGMFVEADSEIYLVTLTELSWKKLRTPKEVADVGDEIRFKVVKIEDIDGGRRLGSVKRAYPESNPWRDPSVYAVGNSFVGTINKVVGFGVFLEHPAGATALLHANEYGHTPPAVGQIVDVVITKCDIERRQMEVRLAVQGAG